jgi:inorganic phosphate transporter, PiT family
MDTTLLAVIGVIALCAAFDYTNGFHDSANSVATIIATGVLRPRQAVAWAAGWNFIAFLVFGTAVANTVAKTVDPGDISLALIFAAVSGATAWNLVSWHLGLPTSSSHALVGGLVGAGVAAAGWDAINMASVEKVAIFLLVSPLVGFTLAAVMTLVLRLVMRGRDTERIGARFGRAQLISSAAVSLGHGGNDAQKTMGVIAAVLIAGGYLDGSGTIDIPLWVVLMAHSAIAAGTYAGGWRIVRTMGHRITELTPLTGFTAETSAATALFVSTAVGAPVSTTQTTAGAIGGVGLASPDTRVEWRTFRQVFGAWLLTVPAAAMIGALTYAVTTGPPPGVAGVVLTAGYLVVAWLAYRSMRSSPGAADFERMSVADGVVTEPVLVDVTDSAEPDPAAVEILPDDAPPVRGEVAS